MFRPLCIAVFVAGLALARAAEPHPSLPPPVISECLGVNIHFTDPRPGELEMLAAAGFKWVRMDFSWEATEKKKGEYDFSAYDHLVAALDQFKIRAVFLLDYGNPLYADPGDVPYFTSRANTPEFRAAFGKWAVAAVQHLKGRGYLWEMWNEPNGGFWKSPDKTGDYIALAKSTGQALRQAGLLGPQGGAFPRGEAFIGPAASLIDLPYLEACFKAGLLDYWDAVSVHPYRQQAPETVEDEYRNLRLLIRKYAPKDKVIPIISGEWGYSSAWAGMGKDEAARVEQQAKYLPREFLTNIANDVALSIWYDWHEDGTDPKEGEHHFGIVANEYHPGRDPVYDPKPAYTAIKRLVDLLRGLRFNKRILVDDQSWSEPSSTRAVIFSDGHSEKVALWDGSAHLDGFKTLFPVSGEKFRIIPVLGDKAEREATSTKDGLVLKTADVGLTIIEPEKRDDFLRIAAASPRMPLDFVYHWPGEALVESSPIKLPADADGNSRWSEYSGDFEGGLSSGLVNATDHEVQLVLGLSSAPVRLKPGEDFPMTVSVEPINRASRKQETQAWHIGFENARGLELNQETTLVCTNPLTVQALPPVNGALPIRVANPSGEPLSGRLEIAFDPINFSDRPEPILKPLVIDQGHYEKVIYVPLPKSSAPCRVTVDVELNFQTAHMRAGNESVLRQEFPAFVPVLSWRGERLHRTADGDPKVAFSLSMEERVQPADKILHGSPQVNIHYQFGAGWKFLEFHPDDRQIAPIDVEKSRGLTLWPTAFGLWLYGDGKSCASRLRFTDTTGQTFQPDGPKIDWTGWRYVTFPMQPTDEKPLSHWGGANDGVIHYPIKWDSIFLLDNVSRQPAEGEIYLSAPTLIY
jgi:hypothetical protein